MPAWQLPVLVGRGVLLVLWHVLAEQGAEGRQMVLCFLAGCHGLPPLLCKTNQRHAENPYEETMK